MEEGRRMSHEDYLEDQDPKAIPKTLFIPDETHLPGVWTTEVTEEVPVEDQDPEASATRAGYSRGFGHPNCRCTLIKHPSESPVEARREPTFARRVFGTGDAPTSLGYALGRLGWLLLALILWAVIGLIIYQSDRGEDISPPASSEDWVEWPIEGGFE